VIASAGMVAFFAVLVWFSTFQKAKNSLPVSKREPAKLIKMRLFSGHGPGALLKTFENGE